MKKCECIVAVSVVFEVPVDPLCPSEEDDSPSMEEADKMVAVDDLKFVFEKLAQIVAVIRLSAVGQIVEERANAEMLGDSWSFAERVLKSAADYEAFDVRVVPIQEVPK